MRKPMNKTIPVEVLRESLEYREEIEDGVLKGNLYWKYRKEMSNNWNEKYVGKKLGTNNGTGYLKFRFSHNKKSYNILNHTAIFCIVKGKYPELMLDHIDGNRKNNLISNLREANYYKNNLNRGAIQNKSSIHKGVYYNIRENKWHTQYRLNYKQYHIGYFKDEIEAAMAYNDAILENHHPEFVVLNKIEDGYTNKEYPNKPRGWKPE